MIVRYLLFFLFFSVIQSFANVSDECESALKSLFSKNISQTEAADFLKVQGDLTLHRMAWAYLKAQKNDPGEKLESIERTILTLLDEKYTSTDSGFKKARDSFEAQPLSRKTLAEIGPYLKDVLSKEFGEKSSPFVLNASDLKMLNALSKFEKKTSSKGKYDSRFLAYKSPQGILNFAKLINSSYKTSLLTASEEALNIEVKLQSLEKTIRISQKRISDFLKDLTVPSQCQEILKKNELNKCQTITTPIGKLFNLNENIQKIFWDSLSDKLISDDILLNNLTYGKIWLRFGNSKSNKKNEYTTTTVGLKSKITKTSPVKKFYSYKNNSGYFIEDPVSIIVKDGHGRNAGQWNKLNSEYLDKMSSAIINDNKVFEINGTIFDRKTGNKLKTEEAIKLMPPLTAAAFRASLTSKNPDFLGKQIVTKLNREQTFTYGIDLYDTNGNLLNAQEIINQVRSKKGNGKNNTLINTKKDPLFLTLLANSLKNNTPHFNYRNQIYDTETGLNLSSPFRSLASATEDFKINKRKRVNYQHFSDKETIINYHRDIPNKKGCQFYAIVDKENANITVYDLMGKKVFNKEVLVGTKFSDEKTKWTEYNDRSHLGSYTTGAGAFTVGEKKTGEYYSKNFNDNLLQIEGQNVFSVHQVPNYLSQRYLAFDTGNPTDRRVSQGCVNMKTGDFIELTKWIKPSCKLYVLPEEKNNKFIVKDEKIELVSTTPITNSNNYNYSLESSIYKPIKINITNDSGKTRDSVIFVKTLEEEKLKLMKIFSLNNDDYNDLAALSYGIMGLESNFGKSLKFWLKEENQLAVVLAKAFKNAWKGKNPLVMSTLNTSRGFTQIKALPDGTWRKNYPNINKTNLDDPKNSAVATIAYLVEAVRILKNIAAENSHDPRKVKITKENLEDYIAYIYQGRKKSLKSVDDLVNPDFNTYVQGLRKNMSYIEIAQEIN